MRTAALIRACVLGLSLTAVAVPATAGERLMSAVRGADVPLAEELLADGADASYAARDGSTPLHWAVHQNHPELVTTLLEAGADVDAKTHIGVTPLALAAGNGSAEVTALLVEAGADVDGTLMNGETPLMMAARTGDAATVEALLDAGAEIEAREELRGTTALMWAAANANPDAVELLLSHGADPSLRARTKGQVDRPYLAPKATERIENFYRGAGIRGDSLSEEELGDEELEIELTREELLARLPEELVERFEQESASQQQEQEQTDQAQSEQNRRGGLAALHFAAREGDLASVERLVEAGADVDRVSSYGWTPLLTATKNRYYDVGAYLLEHGADPNIANGGGWTPLYLATDNRNIEGGDYPVREARGMSHMEFIELLLEHDADPNMRMASSTETRTIFTQQWLYEDGATPFLRASQSSDLELMNLLLDHGADPTITTRDGVDALMVAAGIGWVEGVTYEWSEEANREAVRMLLDLGLDPNAQDDEAQRTALMGAAHKGRPEIVKILVDAGARLDTRDLGSRDSLHKLAGKRWQALDYAEGLVRVGVQSPQPHPETAALIRELMNERGLEVPPKDRTLDSICVVEVCEPPEG